MAKFQSLGSFLDNVNHETSNERPFPTPENHGLHCKGGKNMESTGNKAFHHWLPALGPSRRVTLGQEAVWRGRETERPLRCKPREAGRGVARGRAGFRSEVWAWAGHLARQAGRAGAANPWARIGPSGAFGGGLPNPQGLYSGISWWILSQD